MWACLVTVVAFALFQARRVVRPPAACTKARATICSITLLCNERSSLFVRVCVCVCVCVCVSAYGHRNRLYGGLGGEKVVSVRKGSKVGIAPLCFMPFH